jgi:hypothetical protein
VKPQPIADRFELGWIADHREWKTPMEKARKSY